MIPDDYEPHEVPTAWVAVGTNGSYGQASWFYAFVSYQQAEEFVKLTESRDGTILWDIYPCGMESARAQFQHFKEAYEADEEETQEG